MPDDLRSLMKREKRIRNSLNSVASFVRDYQEDRDKDEVDVRLQLLESAFTEFYEVHEKIEVVLDEADEEQAADTKESEKERQERLDRASKKREADGAALTKDVENCYCKAKAALLKWQQKIRPAITSSSVPVNQPVLSKVKLPEIKLPTFNGKLRDWVSYRDAFQSLIHRNRELTDVDKFTYLRSSLSGEALQEVSSVELSAANYEVAWNALEDRYHNKKLIVKAYLDAIFGIEPLRKENYEALSQLISNFEKNLQMLQKMGQDINGWSTILVHMVCSRLDAVTLRFWETSHNSKEVPVYQNLMTFLKNHCAVLQSVSPSEHSSVDVRKPKLSVSHPSTATGRCCFCAEPFHPAFLCKRFQKLKVCERYDAVRKNGLCMNCLSSGHLAKHCSKGSCRQCGKKHNSLLHSEAYSANTKSSVPLTTKKPPSMPQPQTQPAQTGTPTHQSAPTTNHSEPSTSLSIIHTHSHSTNPQFTTDQLHTLQNTVALPSKTRPSTRQVLLSTAIVRICDDNGSMTLARALLDSCSQHCFVTSDFCRRMKFKEFPNYLTVKGIGHSGSASHKAVSATVSPRFASISNFEEVMQFNVLPKLTIPLPCEGFEISQWNLPDHIVLADPEFYQTSEIDMIIGAEYYLDLLQEGRFRINDDGPTFQNSVFGWIVSGRVSDMRSPVPRTSTTLCSMTELQEQLTRFWELESCQVKSTYSVEESTCEEIFKQTTVRDDDGCFVVSLPKNEHIIERLGDSRRSAERRFASMERRFVTNPQLKQQYCEFMEEYLSMGHMKKVCEEDLVDAVCYFLPHHAVLKPESTTTKLRVVFDASCKTSSGISLNDGLMVGPVVQEDLISIHARFRLHRIGIVADVAKMYRMIKMFLNDQKLQLILWRNSPDEPIQIFQLTTVTYGTASAPFLATRCLVQLAEDGESTYPIAAKVLRKDFYVDDMISGVDSVEEGKQLIEEMVNLTNSAGFTLRKWNSNCEEVLRELQPHLRDDRAVFEMDAPPSTTTVKTLGLVWCPASDNFCFIVPKWNVTPVVTKRIVISDASRLFDPLGLIGPVVVEAKIFIQTLWKLEVNWDDPLPENLQTYWLEYRRNLSSLESVRIPRWVGYTKECVSMEWHGFCDASDNAYGACLYLRCTSPNGSVRVQLMMSKSRVAPLEDLKKKKRKQSTPRLELSSALLLSHLYEKISKATQLEIPSFFWTDSNIVKYWIASTPSRWQTFVANRVSEIQHLTKGGVWNHVSGIENPADVLSRGISATQLEYQSLWFNGPVWLHQGRSFWPEDSEVAVEQLDPASLEERKTVALPLQAKPPNEIFSLRSSLPALVRLVAWIRRFRHNSKATNRCTRKVGCISSQEYEDALLQLVRLSQEECFPQEIASLSREDQVKDSSRISALNAKLRDGILRVGGRLRNAPISENRKHPMIIDHRHPLATLIIQHYHLKMLHSGQQVVIACTRERFWIPNIRNLVRKILHECVTCFRIKPRCQEQLMAELPLERVNPAPPFLKVGVDYCGPFLVTYPQRRSPPVKCFVAVFVCLVTKAIHVELVADLTTEAFLAALKRFTARRGRPTLIMCDNAKNFVGANRELRELLRMFERQQFQNAVSSNAASERIEFKFIPARSPNFGGLWEAAVKCFKNAFKKTIGTRTLLYDEMQTVLAQIEAVLNSRPLTPISNDPGDFEALTPGHFLVHRPLTAIAEPDLEDISANRLSVWQRSQSYVQTLWKKWTTLYLSDLHNRWRYLSVALIFVATAMLCKEQGITITGVCAIYEIFVAQKIRLSDIYHLARSVMSGKSLALPSGWWPHEATRRLAVLCVATVALLFARLQIMGSQLPVFTRFDNPASVSVTPTRQLSYNYLVSVNLWLLLFPCDLCCDWTMGTVPLVESFSDPRNLATLGAYSLIGVLVWLAFLQGDRHRSGVIVMGLAFMILPFLPASNLFFPVGFVIAERVLYMPSMGFCILVAYGFQLLSERWNRKMTWCCLGFLLLTHSVKTYNRNADWESEYTIFMSGLKVNQRNAKLFNNVGHALESEGKFQEALQFFHKAVSVQEDDVGAHINVGRTYNHLKMFKEAEQAYLKAKSLLPKAKPGESYQARIAPNHLNVFLNLANLISKNATRLEEADLLYRQAISMRSDYTQAYINRGDILIKLNRTKEAQEVYERALLYDSTNPDIYYNLGVVFLEQGKASQALAYLDKALEFDPEHEQALLNSAILLQELGRPELRKIARERLLKLLAKDESNERVHFNLGMLAMDDRNTDEAENWFRRAVHLKQDFRSALFNLALLLADDHRPLEAAPFLNQLVKYHPDHIKGLILLGDIYINNIKDLDAAENCYKRILQLDPINIQGLHNLCVVYVERGKLVQAQACLSHAHQLAPTEDYILRHLQIVQTRINRLRGTPDPSREKEIAFADYDPREFGGSPSSPSSSSSSSGVDFQQLINSNSVNSNVNEAGAADEAESGSSSDSADTSSSSNNDNHNNMKTSLPHAKGANDDAVAATAADSSSKASDGSSSADNSDPIFIESEDPISATASAVPARSSSNSEDPLVANESHQQERQSTPSLGHSSSSSSSSSSDSGSSRSSPHSHEHHNQEQQQHHRRRRRSPSHHHHHVKEGSSRSSNSPQQLVGKDLDDPSSGMS